MMLIDKKASWLGHMLHHDGLLRIFYKVEWKANQQQVWKYCMWSAILWWKNVKQSKERLKID